MAKPKPVPSWRSGFCGDDMPLESHRRCDEHPRHDGVPCICPHHQQETTVPDAEQPTPPPSVEPDVSAGHDAERPDPPWIRGTGLPPIPLAHAVKVFAQAAGDLARTTDDAHDYEPDDALALLRVLRASMRKVGQIEDGIVRHLYQNGPKGERLVDGIGFVNVRRRPSKVRWDERGTAAAVVDAMMEERGGVMPDEPMEVVAWLLEVAAIGYYRKTPLRALGLDPQDFYTSEPGTIAVDLSIPD